MQSTTDFMPKNNNQFRQKAILILKLVFVVGLLYFLVRRGFISLQATQQALKQWQIIIPAVVVLLLSTFLGVIRWQWLLRAHDIHLNWMRTCQLTLIGVFFNIALPGAVSGDFVKAYYVGKEVQGQRTRAFGSILFDRVAGLSALVFLSAGALLAGYQLYAHSVLLKAIHVFITIAAMTVIAFYGYLFLVREKHDPLLKLFQVMERRVAKIGIFARIYENLRHYHQHRWTVVKAVIISLLIHLTVGWSCLQFAYALGDTQLSLLSVYIVVPLGLLVTAIPIAPAGVGTGNVAFLYFFHLIGCERGADVYSLFALTNILGGCLGGIIYFRFKGGQSLPDMKPEPIGSPG